MNREQVEKAISTAWREYQNSDSGATMPSENFEKGFFAGAEWRINSVWHDATKEKPQDDMTYLAVFGNGTCIMFYNTICFNRMVNAYNIKLWAYTLDLLAGKEDMV